MNMAKAALLFVAGTAILYLIATLVLFITTVLFSVTLGNIWLTAIYVTAIAELLLLASYLWKKYKKA